MSSGKPELAPDASPGLSAKAGQFTESVIREMTRLALQYGAENLSQGFPDFSAPAEIKRAAQEAIAANINQNAITWGSKSLRNAIADEIYEHMLYDGARHISIATLDGMREHAITINALSKTYSVTGWRVGWVIAAPRMTSAIRKVYDFLTVGAAAPLQEAGTVALGLPPEYYEKLAHDYASRRHARHPYECGLSMFQAARRVLHHDRRLRIRIPGRRRVRAISGERDRRRGGAGIELLSGPSRRADAPSLHVLQVEGNLRGCRG
jgi:hypothetical protein